MKSTMSTSLNEILIRGEYLYLNTLRLELEAKYFGQYVAIDVESEEYVVSESKLDALDQAKEKFNGRLLYTVKIGSLDRPAVNHLVKGYAREIQG